MSSATPNAYEQLKLLQSTYVSSMKYSNSFNFSTFTIFNSVQNLTSDDDYYSARLLASCLGWLVAAAILYLS
jgi:hypothetical protein